MTDSPTREAVEALLVLRDKVWAGTSSRREHADYELAVVSLIRPLAQAYIDHLDAPKPTATCPNCGPGSCFPDCKWKWQPTAREALKGMREWCNAQYGAELDRRSREFPDAVVPQHREKEYQNGAGYRHALSVAIIELNRRLASLGEKS